MPTTSQFINMALTGSIATGKSTLANLWCQHGVTIIDADQLAHHALDPGTDSYHAILKAFSTFILNADHTINRRALGEMVFSDDRQLQALNHIVHPVVARLRREAVQALITNGHTGIVVHAIPLLYETAIERDFDCVVTIACSAATQQARLLAKAFTPAQIVARLHAQWPQQAKMDRADFVIWNDGSLRVLADQADIILKTIQETYHAST